MKFRALAFLAATVFDDCGNLNHVPDTSASSSTAGGLTVPCLPRTCDVICYGDGTRINTGCPIEAFISEKVDPYVDNWIKNALAQPCPAWASPKMVVHFYVPEQFVCLDGTCGNSPDLLPQHCQAVCSVAGGIPSPSGCPDPATNLAMDQFLNDLDGIVCNDQAQTNPYYWAPDPALVDKTVCMHRPPIGRGGSGGAGGWSQGMERRH